MFNVYGSGREKSTMSTRNPLRDGQPREQARGEDIINMRTQRVVRLTMPDGTVQEIVTGMRYSQPDPNGGFVESDLVGIPTDRAGNAFPAVPSNLVGISHSGLYIDSPEKQAICTSWLHPAGLPRTILLGQDGQATANGAVCSRCAFRLETIYAVLGILALGVIWGIWYGAGLF